MKTLIISKQAQQAINERINGELQAEYMYRCLSNCMQFIGFFGAAKFFEKEADQEKEHYQKLVRFANDVGILSELSIIKQPEQAKSIQGAFDIALKAELDLQTIYEKLTVQFQNEPTVFEILLYFTKEQRKSVGEYSDYISRLEIVNNEPGAVLLFDKELGE